MSSAPESQYTESTDVVVLGASFAGIEVVLQLARRTEGRNLSMLVVDRHAEHGYIPLVQERLARVLPAGEATLKTAAFVDSLPNARFVQDEIVSLDVDAKAVALASGRRIEARFIVVALGSVLEPPPELAGREHLLSLKDGPGFAQASAALDERLRQETPPQIVIVGGGISGIELAGELALLHTRRPEDWPRAPRVTLIHAAARLVPELRAGIGRRAEAVLRRLGVEVVAGTRVEAVTAEHVLVRERAHEGASERRLPSNLVFWAGGVRPSPTLAALHLPRTADGWLAVGPTLQCFPTPRPTHPDIFACGDAVRIVGGEGEWQTMQRAIECIWQAAVVARNIHTLSAEPADYPRGVPPLRPHRLREDFFYGVSLGPRSLIVRGPLVIDLPGINHWFRRWLMRRYFARYAPLRG